MRSPDGQTSKSPRHESRCPGRDASGCARRAVQSRRLSLPAGILSSAANTDRCDAWLLRSRQAWPTCILAGWGRQQSCPPGWPMIARRPVAGRPPSRRRRGSGELTTLAIVSLADGDDCPWDLLVRCGPFTARSGEGFAEGRNVPLHVLQVSVYLEATAATGAGRSSRVGVTRRMAWVNNRGTRSIGISLTSHRDKAASRLAGVVLVVDTRWGRAAAAR